ncbi:MAG: radical SAM protein [Vallitalea sp.]|nr:radical SAM protein [Vallitalea sp.]
MGNLQEFEESMMNEMTLIKHSKEKIVLFGGADIGILAKRVLELMGIKVECFCDNDTLKQSKLIEGLKVLSLDNVIKQFVNVRIIICTLNDYNEIAIRKEIEYSGINNIHSIFPLLYFYKTRCIKNPVSQQNMKELISKIKDEDNNLIISAVNIPITEKCTLNCEKCSSLTPYNDYPIHYNKNTIINTIKRFLSVIDGAKRVIITGGEPLLYPDLLLICKEVSQYNNILTIRVVTNGTIIPDISILKCFSDLGISLTISDYGQLSNNKYELIDLCKKYNVLWDINSYNYNTWVDFGRVQVERNRSKNENMQIFKKCYNWVKATYLLNGDYYLCQRAAYATYFKILEKKDGEYVNILDYSLSEQELKNKIKEITYNTKYLTACNYCNTRYGKIIPPAVQKERKLKH